MLSHMRDSDRFKLRFSPYATPQFEYGDVVMDEVRGEMTIVGLTDARIPWQIGKRPKGQKTIVVYAGLADAVRKEANITVCHWRGITPQTVSKWRRALDVERMTPGSSALLSDYFDSDRKTVMYAARVPKYRDPGRSEKIRQSRLGKPRPKHVVEAMRAAHVGKPWTAEKRKKMLEACKRRHPCSYAPWTPEEDELVRSLSIRKVIALTGRPRGVIERRREQLGVPKRRK